MTKTYETHPYAEVFPMMTPQELKELAEDIKRTGELDEPIVLFEGKVLDGRNRLIACDNAGVEPKFVQFEEAFGNRDPLEFVWSRNYARRHLTPSQKAVAALAFADAEKKKAKTRMSKGGKIHLKTGLSKGQEIIPDDEKGQSRDKLAEKLGVNPRYISDAQRLQKQSPKVLADILAGKMSIPDAIRLLDDKSRKTVRKPKPSKYGRDREQIGGQMPRTGMLAQITVAIGSNDMDRRQEVLNEITDTVRQAAGYDERRWMVEIIERYVEGDIIVHPCFDLPRLPKKWSPLVIETRITNCQVTPICVTHVDMDTKTTQHEIWEKDIWYGLEQMLYPDPDTDDDGKSSLDFDKFDKSK